MSILTDEMLLQLIGAAQTNLAQQGFHDLSRDDLQSLWETEGHRDVRLHRIHHFANACGARLEADREMSQARLIRRADNDMEPILPLLRMAQPARRATMRSW
jgi:hypothetical protein